MSLVRNYRLSRDRSLTVANLLDKLVASRGDGEISIENGRVRRLAELHAEVCAMDAFLRSAGLQAGERVAVYRTNDPLCFRWFLAIIRAGGIAVPLNPQLSLVEVRTILARSGTRILVTDRAVFEGTIKDRSALDVETWIQADDEAETLEGFVRAPESAAAAMPPATVEPSATVAIFHTSGTSGFPKGASLSSRALLGARAVSVLVGPFLGARDLALIALPWSHVMAVSIALYGLLAGIRGCFLERFDAASALELVERYRATAFVGVPAMFARLVNSNPEPGRLASIRLWLSASDHLPSTVRERLRSYGALRRIAGLRVPPLLLNGYGMVELGGLAMMGVESMLFPGSGDLCFPVPPHRIRIAGEDGRAVARGAVGELQVYRPGLAAGYWGDEGRNEELLSADGWLRTGDSAVRNRLGLIRLVGRTKEVIKSGGYSVYVRELEETISAHPAVARAAGFGLPHAEKGEVPAAAVELRSGASAEEGELLTFCRQSLAAYKAPRRIWILEPGGMPQNHTGKTLRRVLRERFAAEVS